MDEKFVDTVVVVFDANGKRREKVLHEDVVEELELRQGMSIHWDRKPHHVEAIHRNHEVAGLGTINRLFLRELTS